MEANCSFDTISVETFARILGAYRTTVAAKLNELDTYRYETIPEILARRKSHDEEPFLTPEELGKLVDWKLSHGTFRPTLKKLVGSNSEQSVKSITGMGFAECSSSADKKACLSKLTELKGVGPATASLLLSAYDPVTMPFFSDELFRWSLWRGSPKAGWDRPIKYTPKEYFELYVRVQQLRTRLAGGSDSTVTAVDVERVAYVLGRRRADLSSSSSQQPTSETDPPLGSAPDRGPQAKKRKIGKDGNSANTPRRDTLGGTHTKATRSSKRLRSR